jgi:hypothetical protein
VFCNRYLFPIIKWLLHRLLLTSCVCVVQDVVNSHTCLAFLKETTDFHSRYITESQHTYHTKIPLSLSKEVN